jgi:hypothetical protein
MKDSELDKLESLLMAIDTKPHVFQHEQKFKKLEGDIWEIKIHQIWITCYWKGNDLIAFYGIRKKTTQWSKKDLQQARKQFVGAKADLEN